MLIPIEIAMNRSTSATIMRTIFTILLRKASFPLNGSISSDALFSVSVMSSRAMPFSYSFVLVYTLTTLRISKLRFQLLYSTTMLKGRSSCGIR